MQFFSKTVQKRVKSVQKEETHQAFLLVNAKKLTDDQSNLLFSNQAQALDGEMSKFLSILLISIHMIFLMQLIYSDSFNF